MGIREVESLKSKVESQILDFFFPPFCVACSQRGEWWCRRCREMVDVPRMDPDPPKGLDGVVVTGFYHDPSLRAAIHGLKYSGITEIQPCLDAYLRHWVALRGNPFPWSRETGIAIQHVPASPERVRSRGFDQSEYLRELFFRVVVPGTTRIAVLDRQKGNGLAQASIKNPILREANVKENFCVQRDARVPLAAILVDDVVTTGSTMGEAARVLRIAGAKRVYGLALAIGA